MEASKAALSTGQTTKDFLDQFKLKQWWVVDPRTSGFVGYWDAMVGIALVYTAFVTPVEVGFLPPFTSAADPLFLINQVILALFVLDFFLQFTLMYPENSSSEGSRWISHPRKIALHYLKTWCVHA